jgi:hypothetical protein
MQKTQNQINGSDPTDQHLINIHYVLGALAIKCEQGQLLP